MVRVRKSVLPHHVKERLRHQKLQLQLSQIADQVPKPFGVKKETKDTKLRRVILYMKFLHHKKLELLKKQRGQKGSKAIATECKIKKTTQQALKFSYPTKFSRKAQIIYLKNPKTTEENEPISCTKKMETDNFLNCEKDLGTTNPCIDTENDSSSVAENSTLISANYYELFEKNHNKDNGVKYIPNGVAEFLPQEDFSKDLNKEVNYYNPHLYEKILHTPPSSSNSSVERNMFSNHEIRNNHLERPLMSIENTSNVTELNHFSNSVIKPCASFKEQYEPSNYCFPNNPHCHCDNKNIRASLPPISAFLPRGSRNTRNDDCNDYFLNQPSYRMNQNFINSENYLFDNFYGEEQRSTSASSKMSASNQPYSSDLVSSEESIITYFSNEWVSDDTITDSGSLKESPIKQSFESNGHLMEDESICDLNLIYSKDCSIDLKPSGKRVEIEQAIKESAYKSYASNFFTNKQCEKNHIYPQSMPQLPFAVQKKREKILNDDGCVPRYNCDISPLNEICKPDNEVSYCGTSNCDIFSRKQIKKEPDDYLLPENEKSFSLNNFSQWCPTGYFNAS